MKKKLEADLVSIAHRILKQKNREALDQLLEETLKLYEKLLVLKFVEDNFNDPLPTISFASAQKTLEEVYGSPLTPEGGTEKEETQVLKVAEKPAEDKGGGNGEGVAASPEAGALVAEKTPAAEAKQSEEDKENKGGEGVDTDGDGKAPVAESPLAPERGAEEHHEVKAAVIIVDAEVGLHKEEEQPVTEVPVMPALDIIAETEGQDKDNGSGEGVESPSGKPAVSEAEKENTAESNEGQISPDFEKKQEPVKQKEISFEDFHNYKEPEFVKKGQTWPTDAEAPKAETPEAPKQPEPVKDWRDWEPTPAAGPEKPREEPLLEEPKQEAPQPVKDWRDWEPARAAEPEKPAAPEPPKYTEAPKAEAPQPAAAKPFNDGFARAISLGLNDRIAFEKNLFGGSGEDLNRVLSQLNTLNSFGEAKNFIEDLVKPDYNNWAGKEEYEERFMQIVELKFS